MSLTITIRDEERAETVENALEAAASEIGADLNTSRGRTPDGFVSRADALEEVAESYTGWSP